MTTIETDPAVDVQLSEFAERIAEFSRIGLLELASAIVGSLTSMDELVQLLSGTDHQDMRNLAAAIDWLDDGTISTADHLGASAWILQLDRTQATQCRRRHSDTGMAEYLCELTLGGDTLATIWTVIDRQSNQCTSDVLPNPMADVSRALRDLERPQHRPYRKVSSAEAQQVLMAAHAGEDLVFGDDELEKRSRIHRPLVQFALEHMQWGAAAAANPSPGRCV